MFWAGAACAQKHDLRRSTPELKWDWTHVLMFASQSSESSGSTLWTQSSSLKEDLWQRFHKINLTVGRLWEWWKVCLTSRTPYIPFKIKKNLFNLILKSSAVKSHIFSHESPAKIVFKKHKNEKILDQVLPSCNCVSYPCNRTHVVCGYCCERDYF